MNYQIHTIPVLDALNEKSNCPFCNMAQKLEKDGISFMMGPSYMEDDVRMETNKLGFCGPHLRAMYKEQNRLGLGLMLHTFMQQLNKDMEKLTPGNEDGVKIKKRGKFRAGLAEHLKKVDCSCYLCDKIDRTFKLYFETYIYLWKNDTEAAKLINDAFGYCIPHFIRLIEAAERALWAKDREQFIKCAVMTQKRLMKDLEKDLEWFTLKFDYRNKDAPWHNAKDALPRAISLLNGYKEE